MNGQLITICPACVQPITWKKVTLTRADGYTDWDLEVRCGCGPVVDELLRQWAFEDYRRKLRATVRKDQNHLIDKIMSPGANEILEAACRKEGLEI